jgi:drug/metabolite transporter (DMT)-like permease
MYEVIVILKALTEVAGVAMIGQGVLWVLAGARRDQNLVYGIFKTLTSPVMKAARAITPRVVLDQHIWMVAFFLLMVIWVALTVLKIKIVMENTPAASLIQPVL